MAYCGSEYETLKHLTENNGTNAEFLQLQESESEHNVTSRGIGTKWRNNAVRRAFAALKEALCCKVAKRCGLCLTGCGAISLAFFWVSWWFWNQNDDVGSACPIPYDPTVLGPITQLARAAFCRGPQRIAMRTWDCGPCRDSNLNVVNGSYTPIRGDFLMTNSTYAYVVRVRDQKNVPLRTDPLAGACVLAFRGSMNPANALMDVDFPLRLMEARYRCPQCLVHIGFMNAWESMEDRAVGALKALDCDKDGELIIMGHSLGAAIATIASWALTQVYGFELRMFFSFESPRVGDAAFHYFFNERLASRRPAFRFTYYNDVVPHLPPKIMGYEHVNCEVYYDVAGNYKVCRNTEDPKCSNAWYMLDADLDGAGSGAHCHMSYIANKNMCSC